ncbi:DUF3443 family protein [Paraburkholderia rhizosphaerae]|uniref:Uncharacterized protein DUF3443 n=1 Tax=Paraburkholderia rhizosphaerae TaxID=480658 RepID=A0A4R8LZC9_9BURK|nr:DUF3443 family protein [Paraburkholderia rhizosphaerae]TDY52221.1 uncharacterized protein DUF3443 [Paraburkholderia rhizosphaerae]
MKKLLAVLAFVLALAGCGGGGAGGTSAVGSQISSATQAPNTVSVTVDQKFNLVNAPYVTVTICAPGTSNCATIDHVVVDTGSVGLRLVRSAVPSSLGLVNVKDSAQGNTLAECVEFASGIAWGPISTVDLKIAGETAPSLPVQIVDDSFASIPTDCAEAGPDMAAKGASSFGGNGLIGLDVIRHDCQTSCQFAAASIYYDCAGSNCTGIPVPLAEQVPNPVTKFATDNNGVTLSFPAVGQGGKSTVSGTMTFGVNTQSNNVLPANAQSITTTPFGEVAASFDGLPMPGVLDSGSGAYFFVDPSISQCPSSFSNQPWFCPAGPATISASLQSESGGTLGVSFTLFNAVSELGNGSNAAHAGIGQNVGLFGEGELDMGMTYFYGKTITFGIPDSDQPSTGTAPFYAIQS